MISVFFFKKKMKTTYIFLFKNKKKVFENIYKIGLYSLFKKKTVLKNSFENRKQTAPNFSILSTLPKLAGLLVHPYCLLFPFSPSSFSSVSISQKNYFYQHNQYTTILKGTLPLWIQLLIRRSYSPPTSPTKSVINNVSEPFLLT